MSDRRPEEALHGIASELRTRGRAFALVGGLAVSLRAEVRFTRDVDLALVTHTDAEVEGLIFELRSAGYTPVAVVEHQTAGRLATVRLLSPSGIVVDLLAASSGIEPEVVRHATPFTFEEAGEILVARAEELLAMKILSMTPRRPQDRIDAVSLLLCNETLDLITVREHLNRITERGFHREQDLHEKLRALLVEVQRQC